MHRFTFVACLIAGIVIMVTIFFTSLTVGQYSMSISEVINALLRNSENAMDITVIWELRLPRTAVACLVGIALSLSGLIYQSTFQNELASPDIIGVSSGASVGVAAGLLLGLPLLAVSGLGFVLGTTAMILTILVAKVFRNRSPIMLIIAGILVSGLMGSIVSMIKMWANTDTVLPAIVFWLLGSFSSVNMIHFWILLPVILSCLIFIFIISGKVLNNISLGEEEAKSKGINYKAWRVVVLAIGTILTASSVSVAGAIGWIGLVVPHMTRLLCGHIAQRTIPVAALFGGSFMMVADILARTLTNSEIPIGAITGFLGIIIFIAILSIRRGQKYVID